MWFSNKKVLRTYTTVHAQNVYAHVEDVGGWRKVKTGNADGVTNLGVLLNTARNHDRNVTVFVDEDDNNRITHAYML